MLRSIFAFHFSSSAIRASRIALSAATLAGLTVLGACADSPTSRTITAPPAPLNSTTFGAPGAFANAGAVKVCVDASSPSATYTFTNSQINTVPNALGSWDGADGGTGQDTPNAANGVGYTVNKGAAGCITVLSRTRPDDGFLGGTNCQAPGDPGCDGSKDTMSGVTVTATVPGGELYVKTDCFGDDGVKAPVPNPCGNNNNPTRGYMNADHGVQITFFFGPGAISTGQIAPTATTCQDYKSGTSATLSELMAQLKSGNINNIAPGVFFYYAKVTKGAGQSAGFVQTVGPNPAGLPKYAVNQTQAYLYNSSCTTVATLALNANGTAGSGGTSLPAGNYILGIKFATDAPRGTSVGASFTSGSLLATHNYEGTVNGSLVATTTASVNTVVK